MEATYSLLKSELDSDFIESIKMIFKSKRILISIEEEIDETARIYLNKSLHEKLLKASKKVKKDKDIVRFHGNEFIEKFSSSFNSKVL